MRTITREEWGAAAPRSRPVPVTWPRRGTLWLHHTVGNAVAPRDPGMPGPRWLRALATPARYPAALVRRVRMQRSLAVAARESTAASERQAMRDIQAFHQRGRGWSDIGYAFVCFESGRLYEGRGREVLGAHCPGHNGEPSVALAGDYSARRPSKQQQAKVMILMAELDSARIRGHRDGFPTSCPGNAAYGALVGERRNP